jgi:hypothetical protein
MRLNLVRGNQVRTVVDSPHATFLNKGQQISAGGSYTGAIVLTLS